MSSKTLAAIWWSVCAFLIGATLTTQVLAYQERHRVNPITSPLVSPIEAKVRPTIRFHHMSNEAPKTEDRQPVNVTATVTPTATTVPVLPETGGDFGDEIQN